MACERRLRQTPASAAIGHSKRCMISRCGHPTVRMWVSPLSTARYVGARRVLRHVEEVSGNVAMTCRYYGISRLTYSGWLRRCETEGVDGMRDRSKRARTSPNATRADVIEKIIHPRRHDHFGPRKILMCLQRCIAAPSSPSIAVEGICGRSRRRYRPPRPTRVTTAPRV